MNEKYQKRWNDLIENLDKGAVQPEELKQVVDILMSLISDVKKYTDKQKEALSKDLENSASKLSNEIISTSKKLENKVETFTKNEDFIKNINDIKSNLDRLRGDMPEMPELSDIEDRLGELEDEMDEVEIPDIEEIEQDLPKLGTAIRDGLELISDEKEKLSISAIGFLRQELDELRKKIEIKSSNTVILGGGSSGGKIVRSYDLTGLNGSTKTFALPAFYRVISVHSSSFPFIFKPDIDYTTDGLAMTITFTSEVNESTALANGTTIIITYSEI